MSSRTTLRQKESEDSLSLNEAAWITGVSSKSINAIIDRGEIEARTLGKRAAQREPRSLGLAEVVYIALRRELSETLSAQARRELYEERNR